MLAAACAVLAGCGPPPAKADAERGRRLISQYQCGRCHTVPGVEAARGRVAVTLESFGARSYIAGRVPNGDEALRRWIADPASLVPGTAMPDLGVSDDDARDIAAYLRALR
jgi:cytochrome c